MIKQVFSVSPPLQNDVGSLKDMASVIQRNLSQLFTNAHTHDILTSAPTSNSGNIGDIELVSLNGTAYLYAKFPSPLNWKRIALS